MEDSVVLEDTREKSVSSDLIRGHINTIILRALYDGDKYGYEIIAEIEQKSHGQYSLKQPSLYSALKRLEKDGYVTSYWGGSVSGGRRKYFSLTEAGKTISEQNQAEWEYSRTVIDSLISDKDFDFSNPAPTAVNMRVLKETTSRVPRGEGSDDELDYEPSFDDTEELGKLEARYREQLQELDEKRSELDSRKQAFEEEMRSLPHPPKGVMGVTPGIIGCAEANEVIKIICEYGNILAGKLWQIDLKTMETYTILL